jgi:predicted membrane-bound dolichyl-phosphate-mannose-protein mannosyltransferase
MEVFSVAYVSGSIARQVAQGIILTSEVLLSANVFILKDCCIIKSLGK